MDHPLANLTDAELRLIAEEPLSDTGRELLLRISGATIPHASLDDVFAQENDPYAESAQADFDAAQVKDDE